MPPHCPGFAVVARGRIDVEMAGPFTDLPNCISACVRYNRDAGIILLQTAPLRPPAHMTTPIDIQTIGDQIAIKWNDGKETFYKMEQLRALSPSAENVGEPDLLGNIHGGTSQTKFPGVTVTGWHFVGNYALQFIFSDSHSTGIYAFDYLRRIAEEHQDPA